MDFQSLNSQHSALKGIIESYYFHSSKENESFSFSFFPHYKNAITVYLGSSNTRNEVMSNISADRPDKLCKLYTKNFYSKIDVQISGPFNKVGIVFLPLGLNHFFDAPIGSHISKQINSFSLWDEEFDLLLKEVFAAEDVQEKVSLLDHFFVGKFSGFSNLRLKAAVDFILQSKGDIRVEELAEKLSVNRKTLLRDFRMNLSCTIEEYRKMVKFRFALEAARERGLDSLTQLALDHNYYDQADFNKQFKGLSSESPARLLRELSNLGRMIVKMK